MRKEWAMSDNVSLIMVCLGGNLASGREKEATSEHTSPQAQSRAPSTSKGEARWLEKGEIPDERKREL